MYKLRDMTKTEKDEVCLYGCMIFFIVGFISFVLCFGVGLFFFGFIKGLGFGLFLGMITAIISLLYVLVSEFTVKDNKNAATTTKSSDRP